MNEPACHTSIPGFAIRPARRDDAPIIHGFIRDLARFERLEHECVATEKALENTLFGTRAFAEALIGEFEGAPVGFALFFHNYSTFLARPGVYLEDIYVDPAWRGRGFGTAFLKRVAELATDRGCGRLEWSVLDWNENAIRLYERLGAAPMNEWTTMRVTGDALAALARNGEAGRRASHDEE